MVAHTQSLCVVSVLSSNFELIGFTVLGIVRFYILIVFLETAYSRPLLGSFVGIFSEYDVIYRSNPKSHFLAQKHAI